MIFLLSSLTLRDPDRGHFDPHGGVRDLRLSSRKHCLLKNEPQLRSSRTERGCSCCCCCCCCAGTKGRLLPRRSPGSHPRERDEEGGSDKRTSVTEQQDKEPDLGRRHASALLPLTSAACFRPPREGPSDFSRGVSKTLSSLTSFSFHVRVQSSHDSCSLLDVIIRYVSRTWTLLRQLISVFMILVDRILSRLHYVHHRERYTRHM